ncbi:DUF1146 family protein [Carnobacterium gallinarum]|uniref:DUF1146 family protein n=1 Tax=Carnobacterium gallinarum TaxID=2749 RepID=UPI000A01E69A|nr:DUF1146 family protein [Carnobacterium gallinarum]
MSIFGVQSLLGVISHILFIMLSFWALRAVRFDNWINKGQVRQAQVLYIFLSIVIGYTVSSFFLEFINLSKSLPYLLK